MTYRKALYPSCIRLPTVQQANDHVTTPEFCFVFETLFLTYCPEPPHQNPMTLQLPLEICIEIIHLCRKSWTPGQLAQLCLVSKTFRYYAQIELYMDPGILRGLRYKHFTATVYANKSLQALVRKFYWRMTRATTRRASRP